MRRVSFFACGVLLLASSVVLTGCPDKPSLDTNGATHHFAADETEWTFQVWNGGDTNTVLEFTAWSDQPWITVTPMGRSADVNDKVTVTVKIDRAGTSKATPEFAAGRVFIASNGGDEEIAITTAPDYFTEAFTAGIPLSERSLTFTPDGSLSFFKATNDPASAFPTNPEGGIDITPLFDTDDPVVFTPWSPVSFYGVDYDRFFIGSKGNISFGAKPGSAATLGEHFAVPQITVLSTLDATAGGTVSVKQTPTRVAVTYENVPTAGKAAGSNDVQLELFYDGTIRMTYQNISTPDGLVGLSFGPANRDSQGNSIVPLGFVPSDLESYNTSGMTAAL